MNIVPFLSTAIAIVISWALFAILCSLVNEAFAQIKAERGRFMKKYLFKQLQDLPNGVNWASLLYLHGTIDLLSRATNKPTNDISPNLFAKTLVEVVGNAHLVQMHIPILQEISSTSADTTTQPLDSQSIPGDTGISFLDYQNNYNYSLLYNFKAATQVLKPSDVVAFFTQSIKNAELKASPDGNGAVNESEVYRNLVDQIESWYEEFIERLTLWYKKRTRQRLFIIGLLIGLIVNVDSLQLFNFYNSNPASRQAVINYYEKNADALSSLATRIDTTSPAERITIDSLRKVSKSFLSTVDSLKREANLPIGWRYSILNNKEKSGDNTLLKILGIIVTGFAASFGAPFWFEVLRKAYSKKS